jgi:hypothetical protein
MSVVYKLNQFVVKFAFKTRALVENASKNAYTNWFKKESDFSGDKDECRYRYKSLNHI